MQFRGLRVLPGYFWSFVFTAVLPQVALGAGPVLPSFTEFFFLRVGSNEPTQKKKNGGDKAVRVGARSPVFFSRFSFLPQVPVKRLGRERWTNRKQKRKKISAEKKRRRLHTHEKAKAAVKSDTSCDRKMKKKELGKKKFDTIEFETIQKLFDGDESRSCCVFVADSNQSTP